MRVSLMIPCYVDLYQPEIGLSVVEVLERIGLDVDYPQDFTCCGQPPFNGGFSADAREVAKKVVSTYQSAEYVVVPSGSCAAMVRKFYLDLFRGDPIYAARAESLSNKTYEFSEFLQNKMKISDLGARFKARATFHDGCHGMRELGIRSAPRELLKHVRELELVELDEAETCCGFGGMFSVKFPQISTAMVEVKAGAIQRSGADTLITNDPSCLLHLEGYYRQQGKSLRCLHLAQVLATV